MILTIAEHISNLNIAIISYREFESNVSSSLSKYFVRTYFNHIMPHNPSGYSLDIIQVSITDYLVVISLNNQSSVLWADELGSHYMT